MIQRSSTTRAAGVLIGLTAVGMLSACGGSSAFCDAVNDDTAAAAVVFNPVIPGYDSGPTSPEARLSFMEDVGEAPEGLSEEWETFGDYLEEYDPATFEAEPDDVTKARDALSDAASECLD